MIQIIHRVLCKKNIFLKEFIFTFAYIFIKIIWKDTQENTKSYKGGLRFERKGKNWMDCGQE